MAEYNGYNKIGRGSYPYKSIEEALESEGGNVEKAASGLGITREAMERKIKEQNITIAHANKGIRKQ
jgi:DNA-binding NtrC family response regulator